MDINCPACGHDIDRHSEETADREQGCSPGSVVVLREGQCECIKRPSDIARALLETSERTDYRTALYIGCREAKEGWKPGDNTTRANSDRWIWANGFAAARAEQ